MEKVSKSLTRKFLPFILLLLSACVSPKGVYHTVQPGQTFYSISRVYGVSPQYLARLNNVDDPARLRTGQQLFIPGADRKKEVSVSRPTGPAPTDHRSPAPALPPPATTQPVRTDLVSPQIKDNPAKLTKGLFAWPLKGTVLAHFGRNGSRNCSGIEIAAPEGTPVQAAAAGQVIYSGDGIRGYGHLIILKHADAYFTVYGFNRKTLVSSGTFVQKRERIALSGRPPSGGQPRLHFEIRHGKTAVNPILYLP